MTFDEYQQRAAEFAVYPKDREREYLSLGLISEVGELAGKVKKEIRDGVDLTEGILAECGDCAWYASQICRRYEISESVPLDIRHMIHMDDDADVLLDLAHYATTPQYEENIHEVLCCLEWICAGRNTTLEAVCEANIAKLQSRQERGKLGGSGDNR